MTLNWLQALANANSKLEKNSKATMETSTKPTIPTFFKKKTLTETGQRARQVTLENLRKIKQSQILTDADIDAFGEALVAITNGTSDADENRVRALFHTHDIRKSRILNSNRSGRCSRNLDSNPSCRLQFLQSFSRTRKD